jgi:hypothetical protein
MALLIATIASAALVLAAPFIGRIRAAIQSAFPARPQSLVGT